MKKPIALALAAALPLSFGACSTTSVIATPELVRKLTGPGERQHRIVLEATDGSSVRLDPGSEIRFRCLDGRFTRWYSGGELRVAKDALLLPLRRDRRKGMLLRVSDIAGAEVRNLSHGKTLAVTVAVAAAVAVIVATVVASKGKGAKFGKSRGGGGRGARFGRLRFHRGWRAVRFVPRAVFVPRPIIALNLGYYHHHYHDHGPPPPLPPPPGMDGAPPPPPPPAGAAAPASQPNALAGAQPAPAPGDAPAPPAGAAAAAGTRHEAATPTAAPPARPSGPAPRVAVNRLFSASARRRHAIQLYATAELGTQLHDAIGMTNAISVGMRINNIFELGGGVRYLVTERAAGNDGFSHRATFFGYMGGNFTLDSGGWVSIPFGVDIGGGKDVKVFGRAKMGIRINPTNWLFVGVYPFNPTYSYIDSQATALSRRNEWTFPTTLEVGFRF